MLYVSDKLRAATVEGILGDSEQIAYSGITSGRTYTNVKEALDAIRDVIDDDELVVAKGILDLNERVKELSSTTSNDYVKYIDNIFASGSSEDEFISIIESGSVTEHSFIINDKIVEYSAATPTRKLKYDKTDVDGLLKASDIKQIIIDNELVNSEALNDLNERIEDVEKLDSDERIKKLEIKVQDIGVLSGLSTSAQSTIVEAINEVYSGVVEDERIIASTSANIYKNMGDLDDLETDDKTSLVAAINEINENKGDAINLTSITYDELKELRDSSKLTEGYFYRITDYQCTTAQEGTTSANHAFDIIVRADSTSVLNENAYAILHSGDAYFSNNKLSAWELKYCLDNDTNRFSWADDSSWFGLSMIIARSSTSSEYMYFKFVRDAGNDSEGTFAWKSTSYSNITASATTTTETPTTKDFARCYLEYVNDDGNTATAYQNSRIRNVNSKGIIYYMKDEFGNECSYDFKNIQFYRSYDSNTGLFSIINSDSSGVPCYTFSNSIDSSATDTTDTSLTASNNVYGNVIKKYISPQNKKILLNNNCFFGISCYSNMFGYSCYSNTFGYYCYSNTFGNGCYSNTFSDYCHSNTFKNRCYSNTFGDSCNSNTFKNRCDFNTFGLSCISNTFGDYCMFNTFNKSYSFYNEYKANVRYVTLDSTSGTTSSSSPLNNIVVYPSKSGTSSAKTIIDIPSSDIGTTSTIQYGSIITRE